MFYFLFFLLLLVPHGGIGGGASAAPQSGGGGGGHTGGGISNQVPDGPNKVFVGGIPYTLTESDVIELLGSFGQLKAFHLVKDRESNTSKGSEHYRYKHT